MSKNTKQTHSITNNDSKWLPVFFYYGTGSMHEDDWRWHFYDTVKGSDWLGDQVQPRNSSIN